jgi:hypothetical protein
MLHLDRVAKCRRVTKWYEHLFHDTPLMNDATCEGINNSLLLLLLICNASSNAGHMFEIQLDTSCTEPYVQHEEGVFIRLILSPTNSLDMALIECHQRLVDALHKEFQSIFSDRSFEANEIPEMAKRLAQEWLDSIFEHLDREKEELTREAESSSTKYSLK